MDGYDPLPLNDDDLKMFTKKLISLSVSLSQSLQARITLKLLKLMVTPLFYYSPKQAWIPFEDWYFL